MITVYIWQPGADGIGHAAAKISSGGGEYVSWWPGDGADWSRRLPGQAMPDYETDVRNEGRCADWARTIHGNDEGKGIKWWQAFKNNPNSCYSASGQNCSWVVATFLKACGCDSQIGLLSSHHAYNLPEVSSQIFAPGWAQAARVYLYMSARGNGNPQLSDYADNHTMTWTPTDVLRYVNCVKGRPAEEGLDAASKIAAPRMGGRSAGKKVRKI